MSRLLTAALFVLSSAAPASAECAWVLWTYASYSSYGNYWARHDAFESRKQCIGFLDPEAGRVESPWRDRKSTRLNSSHVAISYAVFCLKKKKKQQQIAQHKTTVQHT